MDQWKSGLIPFSVVGLSCSNPVKEIVNIILKYKFKQIICKSNNLLLIMFYFLNNLL